MLNLKYFLAFVAISVVSCDVYVPQEYWNAKPMTEHPRFQEKMRQLSPNILKTKKDPFIIGGSPAVRGQFPHFVLMLDIYPDNTAYVCGASLIHREWVLTGAFCIDRVAVYFDLYTGIVNSTGPASWSTRAQQSDTRIHPQYNEDFILNDIGMVKLVDAPDDLLSYPYTGMIQMATEAVNLDGMIGSISGFGITQENATYASNILKYGYLRVMSNAMCAEVYGPAIVDSHICAETNGTLSICSSDMGGPFSIVTNGVNRLEGVSSFYSIIGCEHGDPVGFSRVTSFSRWIDDTILGRDPNDDLWGVLRDLQEQYLVTLQNIIEGTGSLIHDEN